MIVSIPEINTIVRGARALGWSDLAVEQIVLTHWEFGQSIEGTAYARYLSVEERDLPNMGVVIFQTILKRSHFPQLFPDDDILRLQ